MTHLADALERISQLEYEVDGLKTALAAERASMANQLQVTVVARQAVADIVIERNKAQDALRALQDKINTPHIQDFIESVRIEAVHQVERWGTAHDAGKTRPDWITLLAYLIGKAAKAHFDRDAPKLLHHIITTAAACLNWHAAETGVDNRMRPGIGP